MNLSDYKSQFISFQKELSSFVFRLVTNQQNTEDIVQDTFIKTLELDQQVCLLLKDVYEFTVPEIMRITDLTEGKVKHALADARKNMTRIFDGRCALVSKNGICHQCTELKGHLNPKQDAQIKAKEIKMVRQGNSEDKDYLLNLRLDLVIGIDPLNAPNNKMTTYMLESCED